MIEIAELVNPDMFYKDSHQDIFEAMRTLYEDRSPIDVVTVSQWLKKKKDLKKTGGVTYLTDLVNSVPTAAHVVGYAKIVKDYYIKRQMISAGSHMVELAFDEASEIEFVLDNAEQSVFGLSQRNVKKGFVHVKEALNESFDRLDELSKTPGGLRGVPTGVKDLDDALSGLQDSNLVILAARPGVGKTSLALNIAQFAAVENKIPVGYFSLEMSNLELVDRMLVSQANIDAWKMKTGNLKDEEFVKLSEALGVMAESPLYIDDTPGISILEMRTKARRLQIEHGLKLVVVDYLQLAVGNGKYDSRVQEVGAISQGLKNLARELRVPVLALSQLSRAIEQRGTKVPQLSDLRESGSIEQDADVVMFLYRENDDNLTDHKLSIAKHRNGPLRTIDLLCRGDRVKFYGVDNKH
jgi:replicative DNA helicase